MAGPQMSELLAPAVVDGHTPTSPARSIKSALVSATTDAMSAAPLSPQRALFSSELGARPPRQVQGPPYPSIVVRSIQGLTGVAEAAQYWRNRFLRQSLSILPGCGWTIEDFWDPKDIHSETPEHYCDVLKYLSEENVLLARTFAVQWSREHPEQLAKTVGVENMASICDPLNPQDIVDKVFIHGESARYPPAFLWQAAQTMRTTMLEMRVEQKLAKPDGSNSLMSSPAEQKTSMPANQNSQTATISDEALVIDDSTRPVQAGDLTDKTTQPSSAVTLPASSSIEPLAAPSDQHVAPSPQRSPPRLVPSYGPPQSGAHHGQPMGAIMGGVAPFAVGSSNMSAQPMYNPKGLQLTTHASHQIHPGGRGENGSRGNPSAYAPRPLPGTVSNTHSPHFNPASMALGQPGTNPQHPLQYAPTSPFMYPTQAYYSSMTHPGVAPSQSMHLLGPNLPPGYVQQGFDARVLGHRGPSIGDLTNHYPVNMSFQHASMQKHENRRNSFYGNSGGSLFDPYNGTKPAFNDVNPGTKPGRGNRTDQADRQRKNSVVDSRPRTGSYGFGRVDTGPANGERYSHHGHKPRLDNPKVLNDKTSGCGETWIGPENTTVTELFVNDIFDDVDAEELMGMFTHMIGVTPLKAGIRHASLSNRSHAFVTFCTSSDARKALEIVGCNPQIRNVPVRVTVPRRFFQISVDQVNHHGSQRLHNKPFEIRESQRITGLPSHDGGDIVTNPEEQDSHPLYSPQDVRSGLPKNTSRQSTDAELTAGGSPDTQKTGTRKILPLEKPNVTQKDSIVEDAVEGGVAEPAIILDSAAVSKDAPKASVETGNVATEEQVPNTITKSDASSASLGAVSPDDQQDPHINAQPLNDLVKAAVEELPLESLTPQQIAVPAQGEFQREWFIEEVERTATTAKIPSEVEGDGPLASQAHTVAEEERSEPTEVEKLLLIPDHAGSDEGVGADTSFTSAQEHFSVADNASDSESKSGPVNHGVDSRIDFAAGEPELEKSASPSTSMTLEALPIPSTDPGPVEQEVTAATKPADPAVKDNFTTDTGAERTQKIAESIKDLTNMATSSVQPSVDVVKKSGPQQTPSLNPFARKPKTQRLKEKVLTKRGKKKLDQEEQEKATKLKAEKGGVPSALNASDVANSFSQGDQSMAVTSPTANSPATLTTKALQTGAEAGQAMKSATDKGKREENDATAFILNRASRIEVEEASGKQTGSTTTIVPIETGLVTLKAKVTQKTPVLATEEASTATALLTLARSPERNGSPRPDRLHESISVECTAKMDNAPTVPKKKKAIPAVPNLKHPPSDRSKASQSSSTATILPANNSTSTETALLNMSPSRRESSASSITLNAGDVALPSPSPTAENFYTPLQTKVMSSSSQEQAPKSKKKKNKKRKKHDAAVDEAPSSAAPSASANTLQGATATVDVDHNCSSASSGTDPNDLLFGSDPFGHQMSHIDAIRKEAKNPDNFYNRTNSKMKETSEKEKHGKEYEQMKASAPGIPDDAFRNIQAYIMENPNFFNLVKK